MKEWFYSLMANHYAKKLIRLDNKVAKANEKLFDYTGKIDKKF